MLLGRGNHKEGNGIMNAFIQGHSCLAFAAAFAAGLTFSFANAATIKAPCTDSGELGLRSCKEYLITGSARGLRAGLSY